MSSIATLPSLLDDLAVRFGPREALISAQRRMTFAELPETTAAMGRGLAARGENVAAFVVLGAPVTVEELLAHCRGLLATFKVPRHVWVRREDELPQKASGKVDKAMLSAEAQRRIAPTGADDPPAGPRAPRA